MSSPRANEQPFLAGLKAIELADGDLATANAGRLLTLYGADVLCVEPPTGSTLRKLGPFPDGIPDREKSASFAGFNFNKRGITLNLETATGRECLDKLLVDVDILLFSRATASTPRLDFSPESLQERFPRLIAACVSPLGFDGPWSDWQAGDLEISAAGGTSIGIGRRDDAPIGLPLGVAGAQGALAAMGGIFSSLLAREADGLGDFVDASAADVWATIHCNYITTFVYRGVTGVRMGNRAGAHYPDSVLPCKDGQIVLDCAQAEMWERFLGLMGNPAWAQDERYQNRRTIAESYHEEVDALITPWLLEHTREELWALARQHRIPLAPVYSIEDVLRHPHMTYRRFFVDMDWQGTRLSVPGLPFNLNTGWQLVTTPSPKLGEHNMEVLEGQLGYDRDDVIRMRAAGII